MEKNNSSKNNEKDTTKNNEFTTLELDFLKQASSLAQEYQKVYERQKRSFIPKKTNK